MHIRAHTCIIHVNVLYVHAMNQFFNLTPIAGSVYTIIFDL